MGKNKSRHANSPNGGNKLGQTLSIEAKFHLALGFFQNEKITDAKILLNEILLADPKHAESWFYSSLIADQEGSPQDAIRHLETALEIESQNLKYLYTIGDFFYEQNYLDEGIKIFELVIKIQPQDYNGYYNLAGFLRKQGEYKKSLLNYNKVLELDEGNINAIFNIGSILIDIKEYIDAIAYFRRVVEIEPNSDDVLNNLGFLYLELDDLEVADEYLKKSALINPNSFNALNNLGKVHGKKGLFLEAIEYFDRAIILKPDYAEAYSNRGSILNELKQFTAALIDFEKALILNPNLAEVYSNRGNAFKEIRRFDEALASYNQAIEIKPDFAEAYSNRGLLYEWLLHYENAIIDYDRAIAVQPNFADAYFNKALCLLRIGDFSNGWELYEWRWKIKELGLIKRSFPQPLWLGKEDLQNKTILLHAEQGLGDTIQFCRYAKLVKESGARVLLEVPKQLFNLLHELEGVDELIESGKPLPVFHYHCPLLSLPLVFNTNLANISSQISYLKNDPNNLMFWRSKLGEKNRLRIGVVWSSASNFKDDKNRSMQLEEFINCIPLDLYQVVSLQKEIKIADKDCFDFLNGNVCHYGADITDFADTAAIAGCVDVVVSTCTSVPHMTSALGIPTWLLLSAHPDWRWFLDREDSPWYPSIKIYRQPSPGDWDSVIQRVRQDLIEYSNNCNL
jgi:tetratricopeptide (TPR) repeat protein